MKDPIERSDVADWWATSITNISPGAIELSGVAIGELISNYSFVEVIWLLLRSERPSLAAARLLEAALVSSVDHGPQAPSIAAARMAATCGVGLNNAVATGINVLGDVHGGAGQQSLEMLNEVLEREADGLSTSDAATATVKRWRSMHRYIPGYGHRFHPIDPRRDPLLDLVSRARDDGDVPGDHLRVGLAVETAIATVTEKNIPINVDGVTAIIYGELGFPPPLARGLFILSRSVGVLAHAWEETQSERRLKGPLPPSVQPTFRRRRTDTEAARRGRYDPSAD